MFSSFRGIRTLQLPVPKSNSGFLFTLALAHQSANILLLLQQYSTLSHLILVIPWSADAVAGEVQTLNKKHRKLNRKQKAADGFKQGEAGQAMGEILCSLTDF